MGKSQMLQAVASIAPRGVYVAGNATTTAGLTVTLHKDSSGDYALEAGALILGDQGCCCIDEFDKMGADYQALLEGNAPYFNQKKKKKKKKKRDDQCKL
jgi:DNA helicase MCM8